MRNCHARHPPNRKPSNRDPLVGGVKAQRDGYLALILGQAAAAKALAEIAALEPVSAERLPERRNVTAQNIGFTVCWLVAVGLVRRYRTWSTRTGTSSSSTGGCPGWTNFGACFGSSEGGVWNGRPYRSRICRKVGLSSRDRT